MRAPNEPDKSGWTAQRHATVAWDYYDHGQKVQAKFHALGACARLGYDRDAMRALTADQLMDILQNAGL